MDQYILALDQGTTSSRAIIFNKAGKILATAQKEFTQIFPEAGLVEHDANEIWSTQIGVAAEAITKAGLSIQNIAAIGITNQRETTVVWDKKTGIPVYNAIVWQDKRTASICESLKEKGLENHVKQTTGLVIDAYFSATKIHWLLENIPNLKEKALSGDILFGTIDSWLVWKFTNEDYKSNNTFVQKILRYNAHNGKYLDLNIAEGQWIE